MKIIKLTIKKLYGVLDQNINFQSGMNLLVGINGSGKTSALNVIRWLLNMQIPILCVTEFDSLYLEFESNNVICKILCKQSNCLLTYGVDSSHKSFPSLTVKLKVNPANLQGDPVFKKNLITSYSRLGPEKNEYETWNFIRKLPKPVMLGLDRTLYVSESDKTYLDDNRHTQSMESVSGNSPLERAMDILNDDYAKRSNRMAKINSSLKNQLFLSAFEGVIFGDYKIKADAPKLKIKHIETVEGRVLNYLKLEGIDLDNIQRENVKHYFSSLKKITVQFQDNPKDMRSDLLYALNANQFEKMKKLLMQFEKVEKQSEDEFQKINLYLETVNKFFKDSGKQILFNDGKLSFIRFDGSSNSNYSYFDVNLLSSGEQQLLLIFTYVAFDVGEGGLLIIDEPELSLHVQWQEGVLDAICNLAEKDAQLVIATHSPILADKKRDCAVIL